MTASKDSAAQDWHNFMLRPARYAEPSHIRGCFNGAISGELAAKLTACARIEERLSKILAARYSLSGRVELETCIEKDRVIALMPSEELGRVAQRAGAVYWGASLATAVLASDVEVLQQQLGQDLYQFALAHRDLSGAVQYLRPIETIGTAVSNDGWRCFEGWRRSLPQAVAERILLKLPAGYEAGGSLGSTFREKGPGIVRCAGSLAEAA